MATSLAALAPLSIDMYLPAFPTIGRDFGATAAEIQLTLSGFMAGFCLGQLGYGPISDRFGRRPLLISGVVLYVVMSVLCATATSVESLVVFRFFQAVETIFVEEEFGDFNEKAYMDVANFEEFWDWAGSEALRPLRGR